MHRSLALAPLLGALLLGATLLGACEQGSSRGASAAAEQPPPVAQNASASSAPPAAPQDSAGGQTPAGGAEEVPGTASLEQLAAMPAGQQLPDGHWKAGVNYDAIVPAQPTDAPPGKVEVMEVFWLGCPHCYALEPFLRTWLRQKPSYIDFVRVPVMWGPVHRLHAQLFYTLEALHRDDLVEKAFDTIHQDNNPLIGTNDADTFDKQLAWAEANGIDGNTFRTTYNSFGVRANLQQAQEITDRYRVEAVPIVIVAGKYSTDVGKAGGPAQLFQLIDDLAAFEHQRPHRG
ncbi:MAG TPA: thiol:disulfide interchange protein DsbA/DsbL [Steroidobacteraceae bacterium]|nr:thiol:disulfide interchange protein DsbA/DsbL [Steroidobacteraceae bacterium]